ncbi:MAG TPA: OmpA family protein [Desulfuromonadales bacterium]|nr:OmpA family protein [Desulfuromonadales bacterium]
MRKNVRVVSFLAVAALAGTLAGCANYEVNTKRGNIPGMYIRYEMQEADRALEAARAAGKDQSCPDEFKAAEAAKNNAYDVFRACHTEEGAALAKKATAMANALCPPKPVAVVAPPAPKSPACNISVDPASIFRGQSANLTWTSQNASDCTIQPGLGAVSPQGSKKITPANDTSYLLVCKGEGGTVDSKTSIKVTDAPKLCSPTILDIKFDTDKSDIKPQYNAELKKVGDFLKEFPNAKGTISGHTDNVASKAYNQKLSLRRAESVRSYIIKNFGIDAGRITAQGFGLTKPIADNKTKEGKAKNRRIEANFNCQ